MGEEEKISDQVDKQGLGIPHLRQDHKHTTEHARCNYSVTINTLYDFTKAMRPRWCSRSFKRHPVRMLNCSAVVIMHMETKAVSCN